MLEVKILKNGVEIGRVEIENIRMNDDGSANYAAKFGVERCGAVGLHQRQIWGFRRLKYNVLGLLKLALETLDEKELELERDTSPSDLAREVRGIGPSFSR